MALIRLTLASLVSYAFSKCEIGQGGSSTLCSGLTESQCQGANGLCRWDASQVGPSIFASTGCIYFDGRSPEECDWDCPEYRAACALLTTKDSCVTAGDGVGRYGCKWWDVDSCETGGHWRHHMSSWGCRDATSCEAAGGHFCSSCTTNDIETLWRDQNTLHLVMAVGDMGNRGKCIPDCGWARIGYDDSSMCDKFSTCYYYLNDIRTSRICSDVPGGANVVVVGVSLLICSLHTLLRAQFP